MQKVCNFSAYLTCKHVIKFVPSTMPGQNIQSTNAPCKSVTCSSVKSKRVNSDVNVIRKNTTNVISYSVIVPVTPVLRHLQITSLHSVTALNVRNE